MSEADSKPAAPSPGASLLGAVQRLLAGAAALATALYVLVNSLYIEFYDDFGVRPEQVGFDRLAVVARSAWVALIFAAVLAPGVLLWTRFAIRKLAGAHDQHAVDASSPRTVTKSKTAKAAGKTSKRQRRERTSGEEAEFHHKKAHLQVIASIVVAVSLLLFALYGLLIWRVNVEAERVAHGHSSEGIRFLVPIIDARANPAAVTWIDPDQTPPDGLLDAPHVTYLGAGAGVTVLLACGETTYVVQSSAVAVTILDQGRADVLTDEEEEAAFEKACG